ncbi:MAG: HD domain-containing protein [Fusobacteriaceae bacterium]
MKIDQIIIEIMREVKERLEKDCSGHDWYHTLRVYKNSLKIAEYETQKNSEKDFDITLLKVSALLHDIADHKFGYTDRDRAEIIEKILQKHGFSESFINDTKKIVNSISFSKGGIPEKYEGKIVQDADRLDALGAIGIARTFAYGGHKGRAMYLPEKTDGSDSIYHFYEKLFLLKNLLNTEGGKILAEERDSFMREIVDRFLKEWSGE